MGLQVWDGMLGSCGFCFEDWFLRVRDEVEGSRSFLSLPGDSRREVLLHSALSIVFLRIVLLTEKSFNSLDRKIVHIHHSKGPKSLKRYL